MVGVSMVIGAATGGERASKGDVGDEAATYGESAESRISTIAL
jgi:hypothetical protein